MWQTQRTSELGVILKVTAEMSILATLNNRQNVVPTLILAKKLMNLSRVAIQ